MKKQLAAWAGCLAIVAAGCTPKPVTPEPESNISADITREQVVTTAEASPAMVGVHDKQGWLDLFANNATIEDPVGTEPHRSSWNGTTASYDKQPLDDFYDTFIAPNEIIFHVKQDIVAGNEIVRDLDIETRMSTGLVVTVPTHLRYRIIEQDGEIKIAHLAALWELNTMIKLVLGDSAGLSTGAEMTLRMLREQGVSGALGYMKGMTTGIFSEGKTKAEAFAEAINNDADSETFTAMFHNEDAVFEYPVAQNELDVAGFDLHRANIIISLSELKSAGWYTSAKFNLSDQGVQHNGIVFFRFHPTSRRIDQVRFFWED